MRQNAFRTDSVSECDYGRIAGHPTRLSRRAYTPFIIDRSLREACACNVEGECEPFRVPFLTNRPCRYVPP